MKLSFDDALSFGRYGSIGAISNLINYLVYISLFKVIGIDIGLCAVIGYLCGGIFSFHFGRTWIFGIRNKFKATQLFKFIISSLLGCLLMNQIILFLTSFYSINASLKWLIAACPTILLNYSLLRIWVFSNKDLKSK